MVWNELVVGDLICEDIIDYMSLIMTENPFKWFQNQFSWLLILLFYSVHTATYVNVP